MLTLPQVIAFGITSPYSAEYPLKMSPSESKIIPIYLQNMVGEKDILLQGEIISGQDIAKLNEKEIIIPFGRKDLTANIEIKIPKTAKHNDKYQITLLFKEISSNQGMIAINNGIAASFPIIIEDSEIKSSPASSAKIIVSIILILIIAIIVITITLILTIRKHKQNIFK